MSTEIKDTVGKDGPHKLSADERWVSFFAVNQHEEVWAEMSARDFIAGVETELNGIFISKDDLPEVTGPEGTGYVICDGKEHFHDETARAATRRSALRLLAVTEWFDKNPSVDEQQVDTLAQILADNEDWPVQDRHKDVARKILASGKVTVND